MPHRNPEAAEESGGLNKKMKRYGAWLGIIVASLGIIFGIDWESWVATQQTQKQITYVEDGYTVTQNTVVQPYAKKPTTVSVDGNKFTAVINCDKKVFIAEIQPGESVRIHHLYYGAVVNRNRCSFNPSGDAAPISGYPGRENLPRYKNDLPFQQFPAHAVIFYLVNDRGKVITADYIQREGGALNFANYSGEKAQLYLVYNFSQALMASEMAEQIGWDGSTASFEAVKH